MRLFVTAMRDAKADLKIRLYAAERLLERGYGKPMQSVEFKDVSERPAAQLTREELLDIAAGGSTGTLTPGSGGRTIQ